MSITITSFERISGSNKWTISGKLAWGTYLTGGSQINNSAIGLSQIETFNILDSANGYMYDSVVSLDQSSVLVKVFRGSGFTPAGTVAAPVFTGTAAALTGTNTAPAFTGTSSGDLDLATPAFSGVGNTAVGQVITTTDNQTMTLNQCAGMWLIQATATTPPNLILSNTAVVAAPAVLTVQGVANTDAGAYKIVKNVVPTGTVAAPTWTAGAYTPAGTNSAPAFTGTPVAAGPGVEVTNGFALNLTDVEFVAVGL